MITFFRKMRQSLLTENKFVKYLLYAIGEIILVVIGILIALQINNSNELKKLEETKHTYYDQLLIDLDKDSNDIQEYIAILESSISTYDNYKDKFKNPEMEIEEVLEELGNVEFRYPILTFNTNTIKILISTGDIKILPPDIRNNIAEITRKQIALENVRNQIDPEYLSLQMKGRQLGFSVFQDRLKNQSKLSDLLNIKNNAAEIILIFEASYSLKNFTEINRLKSLKEMLSEVNALKAKILLEKKQKTSQK